MKLNEEDKKNLKETANDLINQICDVLKISSDNFKVSDEDVNNVVEKYNNIYESVSDTYNDVSTEIEKKYKKIKKNCNKKLKYVTDKEEREKIINKANDIIKETLTSLGVSINDIKEKYFINSDDKVYIKVSQINDDKEETTIFDDIKDSDNENAVQKMTLKKVQKTTNKFKNIKEKLYKEIYDVKEEQHDINELKEDIINEIHEKLENDAYIVHKKTDKNPGAIEVCIINIKPIIIENGDILTDIATEIKKLYEFNDVFYNISNTNDDICITFFFVIND